MKMNKIIRNCSRIISKSRCDNSHVFNLSLFCLDNLSLKTIFACKVRCFGYFLASASTKYGKNLKSRNVFRLSMAVSFTQIYEFIGMKSEDNIETKKLMNKAEQVLEEGNVEEAAVLYNQALQTVQKSTDPENFYLIKEYLGLIAFSLQKYKDAEILLREVEDYLTNEKAGKIDLLRISHIILKLAEIYENLNNFEKAEQYYNACADKLKLKINEAVQIENKNMVQLWLMFLASEAHYYLHRGNYEKAQKYFKKAYDVSLQTEGEISERTVTFLYQLGAVSFQKGDLEEAIDYLKKASELGKHLPGMAQLSDVYITLGNIYLKQGFTADAERLCTQGHKNAVRHKYEKGIEESYACLEQLKNTIL